MKECRDGKKLTHDNCRVGMSVRLTENMKSSAMLSHAKLSAGTCGTVIEHCREGKTDANNYKRVLKVKWPEFVWSHSEADMQSYFVINEH